MPEPPTCGPAVLTPAIPLVPVAFLLTSAHPTVSSLIIVAHTQSRRNERPRRNPSLMVKLTDEPDGVRTGGVPRGGGTMIEIKHKDTGKVLLRMDAATLQGADLRGAYLSEADLTEVDLRAAMLRDTRLRDALLVGTDLTEADLSGADLSGVSLADAILCRANLTKAVLANTELARAQFEDALLVHANFQGAHFWETDLCGADLSGADLTGAICSTHTRSHSRHSNPQSPRETSHHSEDRLLATWE